MRQLKMLRSKIRISKPNGFSRSAREMNIKEKREKMR